MKVVGFLKIHDSHIECSKDLTDVLSIQSNDDEHVNLVNSYLKKGIPIIKFISELFDEDGELIGQNIIYTDGEWVWPSYYIYYLGKYKNLKIPDALLKHVVDKGDKSISITPAEKNYIEYLLAKLLNIKVSSNQSLPSDIQQYLNSKGDIIECY